MLTEHKAAVLGSPVAHSLSPALHRAAYRSLGLDSWTYAAHEVSAENLPGLCGRLGPEWAGLSLTMPLKEAPLAFAEEISPLAGKVGAVNTLVRLPSGGWGGHNTDVYGLTRSMREADVTVALSAVVVGSGATARSAVAALEELGCRELTLVVRDRARTETVSQAEAAGMDVRVCRPEESARPLGSADVVVSTTPGGVEVPLDLPALPADRLPVLLDVVYAGWPTALAAAFADRGARVVSGFEVLLHQAAAQVRLMTGLDAPVEVMRAAGLGAMAAR